MGKECGLQFLTLPLKTQYRLIIVEGFAVVGQEIPMNTTLRIFEDMVRETVLPVTVITVPVVLKNDGHYTNGF